MPLPELNTSGVDVTNTLAKINAMQTGALQRQNLQSEIDARTMNTPSLVNERNMQNLIRDEELTKLRKENKDADALNTLKIKTADLENAAKQAANQKAGFDIMSKDLAVIREHADVPGTYTNYYNNTPPELRKLLIPAVSFADQEQLKTYLGHVGNAINNLKDPIVGTEYETIRPSTPDELTKLKTPFVKEKVKIDADKKPYVLSVSGAESPTIGSEERKKVDARAERALTQKDTELELRARSVSVQEKNAQYKADNANLGWKDATLTDGTAIQTNKKGEHRKVTGVDADGMAVFSPLTLEESTKVGKAQTASDKVAETLLPMYQKAVAPKGGVVAPPAVASPKAIPIAEGRAKAAKLKAANPSQAAKINAQFKAAYGVDL